MGGLAYHRLTDGDREPAKDIDLASENGVPIGIWSDGETIWVADDDHKLYAYRLTAGPGFGHRDTSKEFNLSGDNARATGIWSNGETIWVANPDDEPDDDRDDAKLYAYRLTDGDREPAKDIDLVSTLSDYVRLSVKGKGPLSRLPC